MKGYSRTITMFCIGTLAMSLTACNQYETPEVAAQGPGVENPAAAPYGTVQPAVGGAGNGGGVSGGGAGVGGAGQGAR